MWTGCHGGRPLLAQQRVPIGSRSRMGGDTYRPERWPSAQPRPPSVARPGTSLPCHSGLASPRAPGAAGGRRAVQADPGAIGACLGTGGGPARAARGSPKVWAFRKLGTTLVQHTSKGPHAPFKTEMQGGCFRGVFWVPRPGFRETRQCDKNGKHLWKTCPPCLVTVPGTRGARPLGRA